MTHSTEHKHDSPRTPGHLPGETGPKSGRGRNLTLSREPLLPNDGNQHEHG